MRVPCTIYIKKVHNLECGSRQLQYYTATMLIKPYITLPTSGEFPDCEKREECKRCKEKIKNYLKDRFDKFPLCCKWHQKLLELNEFNKIDYINAIDMTADKVIYCCHHIMNCQEKDDWKQDVMEYLEHTIHSFGMFPEGYGVPLLLADFISYLLHLIEQNKDLKKEIKTYVVTYLKDFSKPSSVKNENPINLLVSKYNIWLKLFPFDLPVFSEAKKYFETRSPLIAENISYNRYSKESKAALISEDKLARYLFNLTNQLLDQINFSKITDNPEIVQYYNKIIVDSGYRIETKILFNSFSNDELKYIDLIKKWLDIQTKYFKDIKGLVNLDIQSKSDKYKDSYREALARIDYYKSFIENKDGYKLSWYDAGVRESDAQITFKAVWYNTGFDVNREVGNGRGFVDYTISKGADDKTLVEFKLASNSKLKNNLKNQLSVYSKANDTKKCITVILFFNDKEYKKVMKILKELKLLNVPNMITIDVRNNKIPASYVV